MIRKPRAAPTIGEMIRAMMIFFRPAQCRAAEPAWAITAPITPPIRACDEEEGSPQYQVIRSQMIAPMTPAKITIWVTSLASTIPLPMVAATLVETIAPAKLSTAAMMMALLTDKARVDTQVAMALAVSWKPLT